jgi:hypothetical protein
MDLLDLVHGVLHVDDGVDPAGLDTRHNGRAHLSPLARGRDTQRHTSELNANFSNRGDKTKIWQQSIE